MLLVLPDRKYRGMLEIMTIEVTKFHKAIYIPALRYLGAFNALATYMGVSRPSIHTESTNSMICKILFKIS